MAIELPIFEQYLLNTTVSKDHKDHILKHLQNNHDIDLIALKIIIEQLEMSEKSPNYQDIFKRYSTDAHERIKHAKLIRLQELTKLQEQSGTFKLHDGFNKECGLKGSKLSGGQK